MTADCAGRRAPAVLVLVLAFTLAPPSAAADLPPPPPEIAAELQRAAGWIMDAANYQVLGQQEEAQKRVASIVSGIATTLERRYPEASIRPYVEAAVEAEARSPRARAFRDLQQRQRPFQQMLSSSPQIEAALDAEQVDLRRAAELRNQPGNDEQGLALGREIARRIHARLGASAPEERILIQVMSRVSALQIELKTGSRNPLNVRDIIASQAARAGGPMKELLETVGNRKSIGLERLGEAMQAAGAGRPDEAVQILRRWLQRDEPYYSQLWQQQGARADLQQGVNSMSDMILSIAERNPTNLEAVRLAYDVTLAFRGRLPEEERRLSAALAERRDPATRRQRRHWYELRERIGHLELQRAEGSALSAQEQGDLAHSTSEEAALLQQLDALAKSGRDQDQPFRVATGLEALRAKLGGDGALVSFVEYRWYTPAQRDVYFWPRRCAAFVLSARTLDWIPLGAMEEVEAAVNDYLRAIGSARASLDSKQAAAQRLYQRALAPLAAFLDGKRHLRVVAEGLLQFIPFQALHDGKSWLADRHLFTYAVAERLLLGEHIPGRTAGPALVLVGGGYGGARAPAVGDRLTRAQFAPLAAIDGEGQRVAALLPGSVRLEGAQATDAALLRDRPPAVLHIAAHGFFLPLGTGAQPDDRGLALVSTGAGPAVPGSSAPAAGATGTQNPPIAEDPRSGMNRSALVLAPATDPSTDGFLTAYEATTLDLWGTQLVVLSACETGRGLPARARGVQGLRTAFFVAGAASLVTSLWSVDDRTTGLLMEAFYRALAQGAGRVEALAQASAVVRAQHPDPFFWAPFILLGDAGPVTLDGRPPTPVAGEDAESRLRRAMAWRRTQHSLTAMGTAEWSAGAERDQALDAYVQPRTLPGEAIPLVLTLLGRHGAVSLVVSPYPGPGRYAIARGQGGFSRVDDPLAPTIAELRPERMDITGEGTLDVAQDSIAEGFVGRFELRLRDGRRIAGQFRLASGQQSLPAPLLRLLQP